MGSPKWLREPLPLVELLQALRYPQGLKAKRRRSRWLAAEHLERSAKTLRWFIDSGLDMEGRAEELLEDMVDGRRETGL